ncbi:MAG: hypothetical protein LBC39_01405 [Methanobrevibacter sp.]|nr:hypothetical protein [Candidatus Methanovirga aequatorialis]
MLFGESNIRSLIVTLCLISLFIINCPCFGCSNSLTNSVEVVSENDIMIEELIHLSS